MAMFKAPKKPAPENTKRAVTFTLAFGEDETLKTVQDALARARCLGVPDFAKVYFIGGLSLYGGRGSTANFSWSEPMRRD
jgi:hypothetical protein